MTKGPAAEPVVRPAPQGAAFSDGLWAVAALLVLLAWEIGGLDLPLTRLFGDADGFVWRNHWLTGGVLQGGARVLGWAVFSAVLAGVWWPLPFARSVPRRDRIWWPTTTLLCLALIPLLKRTSWTSCPWTLVEFGGSVAHHVPHWLFGERDHGPGGCFPSGHASTAFAFVSGWFALRERLARAARLWLIITVGAGLTLGWVQTMRGAHYLSHSLWTAWICWAVSALSFHCTRGWRHAGSANIGPPGLQRGGIDAAALSRFCKRLSEAHGGTVDH